MQKMDGDGLRKLLSVLKDQGYRIIGPTPSDDAIVYADIGGIEDLPRNWTDVQQPGQYRLTRRADGAYFGFNSGPQSWKQFLFPPRERIWSIHKTADGLNLSSERTKTENDQRKVAFVGVRSCDLQAIAIQDRIFLGGRQVDSPYRARREGVLIIGVNCTTASSTCFCVSMGTGPKLDRGFDLALTEVVTDDAPWFLCEPGSERGERILSVLPTEEAGESDLKLAQERIEQAAQNMGRSVDTKGIKELLYRSFEHPRWDEVAKRCLSCGNCTLVCPTCFCSTHEDLQPQTDVHAERWRRWDSCFNLEHSFLHGGSVHQSVKSRYRQWMTHKLASWIDQFGTSGCVGCGRCITWCPVGIDITEETAAIRGTYDHKPN